MLFGLIRRWIRWWLPPVPGPRQRVVETSGTRAVDEFARLRPLGATVFWAVRGAGKTEAVASCCIGCFVYVNCRNFVSGVDMLEWFSRQIYWDGAVSELFAGEFATIVLDHFEQAMEISPTYAKQLLVSLTMDSVHSKAFNVLVCTSDADRALELLQLLPLTSALLGPSMCGRCTENEIRELVDKPLAVELGAVAGTMAFAAHVSSSGLKEEMLRYQAAKTNREWMVGEALLWVYRSDSI